MNILGINAFHADSSAAIIRDGKLIAAAEEERFRRIKHWAGFPSQAIAYCLREANLSIADLDHVAVNQDSRANLGAKWRYMLTAGPGLAFVIDRLKTRHKRENVPELLAACFPKTEFRGVFNNVEHHLAHLFSAFYVSPFRDAVAVSVDGFGDFASTVWGEGHKGHIGVDGKILFPHSLGVFYQALTQYLGFPNYGDEYKVMGLAPYGAPKVMPAMDKIIRILPNGEFELDLEYFTHHRESNSYQWTGGEPKFSNLFSPALEDLLGPRRGADEPLSEHHRNIAHSVQVRYEDAFFNLIEGLQQRNGLTSIALAGGCGANSVANGKIRRRTNFEKVYVQAAAGDAGGAMGAAFAVWSRLGQPRQFEMTHAFWGPHYSDSEMSDLLGNEANALGTAQCAVAKVPDEAELCKQAAALIADGKVVGWFQGRMEWGPRALGNRSILCDPRRGDMKVILNAKIKRRESFRPFAPSVLEEEVSGWFEEDDAVPFMMQVFQIREEKRSEIPAVTHVDGSGRLQSVSQKANPLYHRLIQAFYETTGVPMVLNTSFNENEPVVCRPAEALDCFLRTKMDALIMGSYVVTR
jgi:carbamoyltransferase